jgi:hypothetical protein
MMLSTHRCHCFCKVQDHNLKGEGLGIKGKRHRARLATRKSADINQKIETDAKKKEVAAGCLLEYQTK